MKRKSTQIKTLLYYNRPNLEVWNTTPLREYYVWWSQETLMSTDQMKRRIIEVRPLQVYSHRYIKLSIIFIFTIKLFVSGTVRNCTNKIHLFIIVTLSLSTSSHECQPRSVSEPSLC
jgi:hypothetical protein